jgi:hypothetical protein
MHPRVTRIAIALSLAVAVIVGTAGATVASVTFDPDSGTGYVAKSDIQAVFGWKEGTFQANARRLSFHAARFTAWTWDCVVEGVVQTMSADQESSWPVGSQAVTSAGQRRSVSGFDLLGPGERVPSDGSVATCPAGDPANVSASSTDALYVDLRSQSRIIWSS